MGESYVNMESNPTREIACRYGISISMCQESKTYVRKSHSRHMFRHVDVPHTKIPQTSVGIGIPDRRRTGTWRPTSSSRLPISWSGSRSASPLGYVSSTATASRPTCADVNKDIADKLMIHDGVLCSKPTPITPASAAPASAVPAATALAAPMPSTGGGIVVPITPAPQVSARDRDRETPRLPAPSIL